MLEHSDVVTRLPGRVTPRSIVPSSKLVDRPAGSGPTFPALRVSNPVNLQHGHPM